MADDLDALFPSGPTTRRGLLSAFGRRWAEAMPDPPARWRPPDGARRDPTFDEEPPELVDPVLAGEDLVEEVSASADEPGLHIWWLGQSGFLVSVAGETILFDPYLSDWMTENGDGTGTPHERITGLVAEPSLLSFVDVVTSSHAHLDHLDPGTLPASSRAMPPSSAPPGARTSPPSAPAGPRTPRSMPARRGVRRLLVEAVPAYHEGAPEAVGYIVRNGAYTFYHAGDSRRVQGMAEAVGPHGVDVAFVPINGQQRHHGRCRRRAPRLRGRRAHRDPLPLRDVPATTRRARPGSSRSASGSARSTGCRGPASGSRSATTL